MTTEQLIRLLKSARDMAEKLQRLEVYENFEVKEPTTKIMALADIQNTIYEVEQELERVQLAQ